MREKSFFFSFFVILLLVFAVAVSITFSKESTCVGCHTDETVLKSLFKPPKISLEEGEG